MKLLFYNTLIRKKEEFKPLVKGSVGIYCCGPTVYHYAHIGNLRAYIFNDILRRVLEFDGYNVKHVMNITDVGHLTSDADSGEDKMLKGARREGKSVWEIAKFYEKAFFEDADGLNLLRPSIVCRATEHIKEMLELVKRIEERGYTYVSEGNVYFDTSKFKNYAKLGMLKIKEQQVGTRVKIDAAKKNPADFVLWFTKSKFGEQEMQWDSPWGRGFPGWHLECSAMSIKYLGEQFDIHCGGIDHIPVHHTNELAQSEAATGKQPWVKYWLHNEFLVMDKGKMAKSSGEFLRMQTLADKGFEPLVYRYFCLGAQYRQQLKFSWEGMEGAKNTFNRLKEKILELREGIEKRVEKAAESAYKKGKTNEYFEEFKTVVNDDLNTPQALSIMWSVIRDEELSDKEKLELLYKFDEVLGLDFRNFKREKINVPEGVMKLVRERDKARAEKNWKRADELREKIKEKGFVVKDGAKGSLVELS